jgi:virulence-associated protein VapD
MQMNDEEIREFLNAFDDFMKHAEMEEFKFVQRSEYDRYQKESKMAIEMEIEQKAAELEVTVDYYIAEFM